MIEIIDQTGYIIAMRIGSRLRWHDLIVGAKDVDLIVSGAHMAGVESLELRPDEYIRALGSSESWPLTADGVVCIRPPRRDPRELIASMAAMEPGFEAEVVVNHPDTGEALRRIALSGCRWGPPSLGHVSESGKPIVNFPLRAEGVRDDDLIGVR